MAIRFLSNQTIDSTLDLTGRVKVSGSNTDQYYFEGQRNGVGVTYRLYDNSNNVYHDSWTSQIFRINQNGGSGGYLGVFGGNVGIGITPASSVALDVKEPDSSNDLILGLTAGTGARAQIRSVVQTSTESALSFHTTLSSSTQERLRILNTGAFSLGNSGTNYGTAGQVLTSNGNSAPYWSTPTSGTITGSGTANYVTKFTGTTAIGNSSIYDTGSYTSIGGTDTSGRLTVHSTGDVEYLTLNTTSTTNKRVRLQFTQNDNAGIEIATDYSVNNSSNMYIYDRVAGGSAWLFTSRTTNWFQGKLGVGFTSGPSTELHVAGSTGLTGFGNCMIMVEDSSDDYSGIIFKGSTNYNAAIRTENGTALTFWQNGGTGTSWNKRMTLDSSGNLIVNGETALATASNRGNITIDGTNSILSFGLSGSLAGYIFMETGQMLINSGTRHINFEVDGNITVEFQDNANKLSTGTNNHNWFPYVDGNNYYSADTHIFRSSANSNEFIHMYQNSVYPFRWRRTSSDVQGKLYSDSGGAGIAATDLNYAGMYMVPNTSIDWRVNGSVRLVLAASGDVTVGSGKLAIRDTYFGYSSGYKVVQYGNCTTTSAISLGYDPIGNASGNFTGNEILIPNNKRILAPNAADNSYYGVMMFDSNNKLLLGSQNYLIESNFIMALNPATRYVGIQTSDPTHPLHVQGFIATNNSSNTSGLLIRKNNNTIGGIVQEGAWEGNSGEDLAIFAETSKNIKFYSNGSGSVKTYIDSGGLVAYTPTSSNTGASGDHTNMTAYPLKIDGGPDYWRIPHISPNSTVSGVYNYQTGKNVYWGEPTDTGLYQFRGRSVLIDVVDNSPLTIRSTQTTNIVDIGSSTQTQYSNIILNSNSGNAQIWKAGTAYTSYGGTSALNIYNSNGIIAFHPQGTDNTVKMSSNGPGLLVDGQSYASNGSNGYSEGNIVAYSESGQQATIIAEHGGDGYANLNLGSNVNGRKFWHISKRTNSDAHRLEYYYYAAGFTSRFIFTTSGDFHADGDIVAYSTTASDEKLKDNIKPIQNALDKVSKLNGVSFTWNCGSRKDEKDLGVIAQNVEKVLPELVREKESPYHDDQTIKTVDYEKLTAVLIEAVKELQQKVEKLEKKKCCCK